MVCHPYSDRVECHDTGKPQVIKPTLGKGENRIAFLRTLHEELIAYLEMKKPAHVAVEYPNLGMGKRTVNRHVGEVTGVVVSAALQAGASVEQS
jgi:Holliday junction resolvasome RuvABC endonuclease subunit